jgi:hypothetical protein
MKFLENLKLDKWFVVLLYLGVLMIAASMIFNVEFLEEKHAFGFGLGLILIGLSFWIAEKNYSQFVPPSAYTGGSAGILQWKNIKHNVVTVILLILGLVLTGLFGFLIVRSLI